MEAAIGTLTCIRTAVSVTRSRSRDLCEGRSAFPPRFGVGPPPFAVGPPPFVVSQLPFVVGLSNHAPFDEVKGERIQWPPSSPTAIPTDLSNRLDTY